MWTKGAVVKKAFESMGLAAYVFDLSPDELQSAVQSMDMMIASWNGRGIRLAYALESDPDGASVDQASGLADSDIECVVCNLAVRLAPSYGKTTPPEIGRTARETFDAMLSRSTEMPTVQMPRTMPMGAGYKRRNQRPFFSPADPVDAGNDGEITLE